MNKTEKYTVWLISGFVILCGIYYLIKILSLNIVAVPPEGIILPNNLNSSESSTTPTFPNTGFQSKYD